VLREQRFSSSPLHQSGYRPRTYPSGDPRAELPAADMLTMDPPGHTRLRRLVSRAFTPRAIAGLEPWIRDATGRLLTPLDAAAGFDLIDALAFPLPIAVICHLLGVPAGDQASFRACGHDIATSLDSARTAESQSRSSELALTAYLRELVRKRRADPDDSLLSALVAAGEEGDRLSSDELVSTALLRYDSPVQLTSRIATEDTDVGGAVIPGGASIIVAIGGANRDPDVFDQPDRLRIDRPDASRHLSFSLGIHHCLGAALARLEGRIAVEELTRRYPGLQIAGTPARRPLLVLRGFESIPVRASPPPAHHRRSERLAP
jgi:cytochrome P450